MPSIKPFRFALFAFAAAATALPSVSSLPGRAQSQESAVYTISNNDGYGIADCMRAGSACGRAMANSWCEAHGHSHAVSFGSGDDVTGATGTAAGPVKLAAGDVVIRCGD